MRDNFRELVYRIQLQKRSIRLVSVNWTSFKSCVYLTVAPYLLLIVWMVYFSRGKVNVSGNELKIARITDSFTKCTVIFVVSLVGSINFAKLINHFYAF